MPCHDSTLLLKMVVHLEISNPALYQQTPMLGLPPL
jgi:hypothetical protein